MATDEADSDNKFSPEDYGEEDKENNEADVEFEFEMKSDSDSEISAAAGLPSGLRNRSAAPRGRRRPPGPVRVSFAGADALHRAPDARDEPVTGPRVRVLSLACSLPRVSSGRDDERAFYGNSRRGACCIRLVRAHTPGMIASLI